MKVARHREQPGSQLRVRAKLRGPGDESQPGFFEQIFSDLAPARQPGQKVEQPRVEGVVDRVKRVLTHDRPTLLAADENLFTAGLAYHARDLEEELTLIEVTRSQLARILSTMSPDVLARVGVHSERGELTLERILTTVNYHIPHHLPFIAEKKKALGVG